MQSQGQPVTPGQEAIFPGTAAPAKHHFARILSLVALGLFVVNAVAVISLAEMAPAALQQHILWGALFAALAIHGGGKWALDCWLPRGLTRLDSHGGGVSARS